ncbi:LacI family DNA-binding transcriptional regulator [Cohnella caldifontis]|uniref:LacI family DNA-binding transcriptional regulator n=1 Tax=Cohnella caldifontis TaxID=3027471 RepID=UPI0023EC0AF6|nr:LacI family DNA-binding transcriptional regulator [Cohnella sp. YIM B05605]
MKITINDVAARAQVSKATVSRVLNQNPQVKEEIRQRVQQAIEELGFRPNAVARNLANNTSNMIGLIVPDMTNPYFPVLARGIEDAAHMYGYSLFISNSDNEPKIEREYIQRMVEQQAAGIVLISSILKEEQVTGLSSLRTPIVLCDRLVSGAPFDAVSIDNRQAAFDAVRYLIGLGHRRICHLAGPNFVQSSEMRKLGYLAAMEEAGLEPFYSNGAFHYESGVQQMEAILKEYRPTAVFASNDLVAYGAINVIEDRGLKVPDDISVIGCDDILFSRMSRPKLSTISIPAYQIGVTAVKLLDERVKGVRSETKNVILKHELVHRETCSGEDRTYGF